MGLARLDCERGLVGAVPLEGRLTLVVEEEPAAFVAVRGVCEVGPQLASMQRADRETLRAAVGPRPPRLSGEDLRVEGLVLSLILSAQVEEECADKRRGA